MTDRGGLGLLAILMNVFCFGCSSAPPPAMGPARKMSEKLIASIHEPFSIMDTTPYYPPTSLIVSPDSRRFAYAADVDGGWKVVVDGVAGPLCKHVFRDSFAFSPDSQRIA